MSDEKHIASGEMILVTQDILQTLQKVGGISEQVLKQIEDSPHSFIESHDLAPDRLRENSQAAKRFREFSRNNPRLAARFKQLQGQYPDRPARDVYLLAFALDRRDLG